MLDNSLPSGSYFCYAHPRMSETKANAPRSGSGAHAGHGSSKASSLKRFFALPVYDVLDCLERLASTRRPGLLMFGMLAVGCLAWFVYVPIHELLHVAGCVLTGGDVYQLEIKPWYGGTLLARFFPWVVSGSDYAGRLSGFDTKGSDLTYLATDFSPFLLTVLFGVLLLKLCARRPHPILFPIAVVLALAPFYNIPGDYFEMGSILTTRGLTPIAGPRFAAPPAAENEEEAPAGIVGGDTDAAFRGLRSDDVFTLLTDFFTRPAALGINGFGLFAAGIGIILVSFGMAVLLAFATYAAGHFVARVILPQNR